MTILIPLALPVYLFIHNLASFVVYKSRHTQQLSVTFVNTYRTHIMHIIYMILVP